MDHLVRLLMPTDINSKTYFAKQPFTFVERKTGIDLQTQNWCECAVLDDKQTSIMVTLFRCFKKTVLTNGEIGGQILGELNFKYSIVPMQANTTYTDLIRLQDCMQARFQSTSFRVEKAYQLPSPKVTLE